MLKSNSILIADNNECNEHIYGYFEGTFTIIMNKISKKYLDSYSITNLTVLSNACLKMAIKFPMF
jgi:hypothetical protein